MTQTLFEDGDRRQAQRREDDIEGKGWRGNVMIAACSILFSVLGWMATTTASDIAELKRDGARKDTEIAVLKESVANTNKLLSDIKTIVESLRERRR